MAKQKKPDILTLFGTNLKKRRAEKGLSQRDISNRTTIDNADISRMENAQINITLTTLNQLAEAMELNAFELLIP